MTRESQSCKCLKNTEKFPTRQRAVTFDHHIVSLDNPDSTLTLETS